MVWQARFGAPLLFELAAHAMDEATEMLVDGLISIEESAQASIHWNGEDYPCVGGAALAGRLLQEFGWQTSAEVPIVVRTAVLPAGKRPQAKQTLTYTSSPEDTSVKLRIKDATPFRAAFIVLACESPSGGA